MTLRDDLIAAKARIDTPEKWIKGALTKDGRQCAWQALCPQVDLIRARAAAEHLERLISRGASPNGLRTLVRFNDAPETTHADIIALFDRAIEAASHTMSSLSRNLPFIIRGSLIRPSQLHPQHGLLPQHYPVLDIQFGMRSAYGLDDAVLGKQQLHGAGNVGDIASEGGSDVPLERYAGQAKAGSSIHAEERGRSYGAGQG